MLLLPAVGVAKAGVALAVLGGAGVPLDGRHSSEVGPNAGVVLGWEIRTGKAVVTPEAMVRLNLGAPVLTAPVGAAVAWGSTVRAGGYAHLGIPIVSYPVPGVHAGGLVGLAPSGRWRFSVRAGYELANAVHAKCGSCPQPADHWLALDVTAGLAW